MLRNESREAPQPIRGHEAARLACKRLDGDEMAQAPGRASTSREPSELISDVMV